ncbi:MULTISPECIES: SspB family protein [Roseobacteraceae]|uniref:Stringent starvation protein B n=1 Tax=Pseudosulfitobacter pseudonitzschiae TaxID=1402135 RepID=A0A221JZU9_9RHOB|nr:MULTISPECIES: ClpXP protease specificity-enhancing factor SspB [Roseobacteraceae]ASM72249.1 stringent starvation protein B [Pseudosulfitobacter pseudonitzschiae]
MGRNIDYGNLMHDAMRGLIRKVLQDVADNGLPGAHHFFITFDTSHPDAELADWLSDRYPGEMTVVMQHWYDKLEVTDDGFSITLNFGDAPEPLYIPYDAIKTFVDPSVEFGLRFEVQDPAEDDDLTGQTTEQDKHEVVPSPVKHTDHTDAKKEPGKKDAEVVSLDSFRKP